MKTEFERVQTPQQAGALLRELVTEQDAGDGNYFRSQYNRFLYSVERIRELRPPPCRVLDIGSHYLHQATMLSLMGYEVTGLDVPLFTEPAFVRERASRMRIQNETSTGHQLGEFLTAKENAFDIVLCTEILEHIAFNPVEFWHRVWVLLAPGGFIYLTTPNAFRIRALSKHLIRLLSGEGVGLPVSEVMSVITYGHHWKEYSAREVRRYFAILSPDFSVATRTYPESERSGLIGEALEMIPFFRTNVEAVIRIGQKTRFIEPPVLQMMISSKPVQP